MEANIVFSGILYLTVLCLLSVLLFSYVLAYKIDRKPFALAQCCFISSVWFLVFVAEYNMIVTLLGLNWGHFPWPWTRAVLLGASTAFWLKETWTKNKELAKR